MLEQGPAPLLLNKINIFFFFSFSLSRFPFLVLVLLLLRAPRKSGIAEIRRERNICSYSFPSCAHKKSKNKKKRLLREYKGSMTLTLEYEDAMNNFTTKQIVNLEEKEKAETVSLRLESSFSSKTLALQSPPRFSDDDDDKKRRVLCTPSLPLSLSRAIFYHRRGIRACGHSGRSAVERLDRRRRG